MKIEGSVKPISETRFMKSGLNGGVRSVRASGTKVALLTTCSGASDDTTNICSS
jgi:hypothetical protein